MRVLHLVVAALFAAASGITGWAAGPTDVTVSRSAERGVAFRPDAACDLDTVTALAADRPDVRQFVLMTTRDFGDTTGTVEVAVLLPDGRWACRRSTQTAMFGRSGTRPLLDRRSGDGTTPAGVFPLATVRAWDGEVFSMFGNRPDPGVLVPYRDVQPEDCWGATPGTRRYQHLVELPRCPGPDDEWLPRYGDVYSHAAVIGANLDPISGDEAGEPPYAAAIFLHRHDLRPDGTAEPTSGCVSLSLDDLVATLRSIDPRLNPHFAIGPVDWLRSSTRLTSRPIILTRGIR